MRYSHILAAVYGQPWAIRVEDWYAIHNIVLQRVIQRPDTAPAPPANLPEAARPRRDIWGDALDEYDFKRGVARIPIKGALIKGAGLIDKMCGAVSHEDVHADLDRALSDKAESILLDWSCPGGMVLGTPELGQRIADIRRSGIRIASYTETFRCSAAEWIAAGSTDIFATPSSMVGSVGVIWELRNVAKLLEANGVEYHVFASGKYKAFGHPALPMSKEHQQWAQEEVDRVGKGFRDHMRTWRPRIKDDAMEGQVITGKDAYRAGLIDAVVADIGEVYSILGA